MFIMNEIFIAEYIYLIKKYILKEEKNICTLD